MSKAHLAGRQAELGRPDGYVVGDFEDDGREVVKKTYKSGKPAEKPGFFLGGSDPTVPTGPKRKLRASWLADPGPPKEELSPIPKPTKRWTPIGGGKKSLPDRSKSHDGTMSAASRKGKKSAKPEEDEAKKEEDTTSEPEEEEETDGTAEEEVPAEEPNAVVEEVEQEEAKPAKEVAAKKEAAWTPPAITIRKPVKPTEEDKKEQDVKTPESVPAPAPTTNANGECSPCVEKDALLAKQAAEIEQLKAEKAELAKQVKKIKGSQRVNTELKEQVYELQRQVDKKETQDANSKAFSKLESKLNTLKMVMDGTVNKNSLDDLQEHVSMLNMVLNQDLKKQGMKNVWA